MNELISLVQRLCCNLHFLQTNLPTTLQIVHYRDKIGDKSLLKGTLNFSSSSKIRSPRPDTTDECVGDTERLLPG
ncbi:hypothetical protein [Desulfofustis glycolicus]|uniref:hypothetical protein n=1 Tax=Desulfofustis glycolicus TaxID=51195 RepID=UPI0014289423|nr:hypothetical protein [Desulfofustis glycolicus]MCB2215335.1 hypothetical protein [Desulfobulbaceae bacterium]